jgi:FKBP-type peptidyl-prolyl cis-trans isomerase SlpA
MHFTVSLSTGEILDSTHERSEPPSFEFGDGNLLPGFEKAIEGMQAGDQGRFMIAAEDGFGVWQEDNVQHFPRHQFGEQLLEPGMVMQFSDASGGELPGVIKALPENAVEVDFNHPLAGRELVFEVDVLRVIDADARPVTLN